MIKELKIWENDIPLYDENIPFENKMTAYLHEDGEVHPAMIVYPGGAYGVLAFEKEGRAIAEFLAQNGIAGIAVKYPLGSMFGHFKRHPAMVESAQRVIRLIRYYAPQLGIDPDRILLEDQATSTMENLRFSMALLDEGETVAIVSNESGGSGTRHARFCGVLLSGGDDGKRICPRHKPRQSYRKKSAG